MTRFLSLITFPLVLLLGACGMQLGGQPVQPLSNDVALTGETQLDENAYLLGSAAVRGVALGLTAAAENDVLVGGNAARARALLGKLNAAWQLADTAYLTGDAVTFNRRLHCVRSFAAQGEAIVAGRASPPMDPGCAP